MSGGHWEYFQYRLSNIAEDIQGEADNSGKEKTKKELEESFHNPDWYERYPEDKFHTTYPDEVIKELRKAVDFIKVAQAYVQRCDWLFSGDDGNDCFLRRLKEDLGKLDLHNKEIIRTLAPTDR